MHWPRLRQLETNFSLAALRSTDDDDDIFVSCELRIGV